MLNTKHVIYKKLPENFGSSEKRDPIWMQSSHAPYLRAAATVTPGVGSYHIEKKESKKNRYFNYCMAATHLLERRTVGNERLELAVRSAIVNGGVQSAANAAHDAKLTHKVSSERFPPTSLETPGPGSYYIPSKTDINMVDFKYNPKYKGKPRA